jgi:tetratricopeptide (TPR) repeat protein
LKTFTFNYVKGDDFMNPKSTLIKLVTTQFFCMLILLGTATAQNLKAQSGAQYHLKRGNAYAAQEKWQHAIAEYDQALNMDSHNAAAYDARGLAWLALKDSGLALKDFKQAIKLAPAYAEAYLHRGQALLAQGKGREAERDFARSNELKSQSNTLAALPGSGRR